MVDYYVGKENETMDNLKVRINGEEITVYIRRGPVIRPTVFTRVGRYIDRTIQDRLKDTFYELAFNKDLQIQDSTKILNVGRLLYYIESGKFKYFSDELSSSLKKDFKEVIDYVEANYKEYSESLIANWDTSIAQSLDCAIKKLELRIERLNQIKEKEKQKCQQELT